MSGTRGDGEVTIELARRISTGDPEAEREFFARYYRSIRFILQRRTCDHALAEDLAQETLLTVLQRLRDGTVEQPEYLERFLQQTAKFTYIGWTRKRANQTEYRPTVDDEAGVLDTEQDVEREETRRIVRELIDDIPVARDRELLHRFYVRDEEKPDICKALGLTADHFDKVISRARARFRKLAKARLGT